MPLLTPFLFKQGPTETLFDIPSFPRNAPAPRITHILNTFHDKNNPFNNQVQQLTFKTLTISRKLTRSKVQCIAVPSQDGHVPVPDGVVSASPIARTVQDISGFAIPKPLPLLFDVLERGIAKSFELDADDEEDFIVYTNIDIHLLPQFYSALTNLINRGYETIIINRRTIPMCPPDPANLSLMFAEFGIDHPGLDCFVFPRRNWNAFVRTNACLGAGWVMRSFLYNLVVTARRMLIVTHGHLTFHIGDDRPWADPALQDYLDFNLNAAAELVLKLAATPFHRAKLKEFCESHDEPQSIRALLS